MQRIGTTLAAAVAAMLLTATAVAAPRTVDWRGMTLEAKRALLIQVIHRDHQSVRWWVNHRPASEQQFFGLRLPAIPSHEIEVCPSLGIETPERLCEKATQMRHARLVLARLVELPAHDALWECLLGHEGMGDPHNQNTGGNGHWGGLQMHPDWGYGTSWHASDDPWIVQKQAAERGYAASGYSIGWLDGQWGQTIGFCSQFE